MIFGMHYGVWLVLAGLAVMLCDKPVRHSWQQPHSAWAGKWGLGIVVVGIVACVVQIVS